MKVLVTGVKGQLGHDMMDVLEKHGIECRGADIQDFDITNARGTMDFIQGYGPDVVVHCSAYTAVDRAEDEAELCRNVNVDGTRNVASACRETGAKLVYISTDYIFPGTGETSYETDSETGPLSVYGVTKLEGEHAVKGLLDRYFILRISWAFGKNGNNFVATMLRLSREKDEVRVVMDQVGSPTYTADLAKLLLEMIQTDKYGIYHATNEGTCSFAQFAQEIFRQAGRATKVISIPSAEYPAKAERPYNSRLSKASLDSAGFGRLPDWKDALHRYLESIGAIG